MKDFAADPWVALKFGENTGDGGGEGFGNDFGKVNEEDDAGVVSLSKHAHHDRACFGEVEAGEDFWRFFFDLVLEPVSFEELTAKGQGRDVGLERKKVEGKFQLTRGGGKRGNERGGRGLHGSIMA